MPYITLPSLVASTVVTASYIDQLFDNLRVISLHNHSGSAGEGSSSLSISTSAASPYTNRYEIYPFIAPSNTAFNTFSVASTVIFNGYMQTSGACPASIMFPIAVFSGVYKFQMMHEKNTNLGIASVLIGTSVIGAIDMYAAAQSINQVTSITASIPVSASYVITIRCDGGKNVSSTASTVHFQALKIKKTSNY